VRKRSSLSIQSNSPWQLAVGRSCPQVLGTSFNDSWITSSGSWQEPNDHFETLCPAIILGWESKRERQTRDEFDAAEDIDTEESENG
jgi:hypothetical protein